LIVVAKDEAPQSLQSSVVVSVEVWHRQSVFCLLVTSSYSELVHCQTVLRDSMPEFTRTQHGFTNKQPVFSKRTSCAL